MQKYQGRPVLCNYSGLWAFKSTSAGDKPFGASRREHKVLVYIGLGPGDPPGLLRSGKKLSHGVDPLVPLLFASPGVSGGGPWDRY